MSTKCIHGFTLIEMIVALAIGAAIAMVTYRALDGAIQADEKVSTIVQQIDDIDRVWQYLNSDLLYAVGRQWVDTSGSPHSAFKGAGDDRLSQSDLLVASEADYLVQFVRSNRDNLLNYPRSDIYRVGYRLTQQDGSDHKTLWRDAVVTMDSGADPTVQQRRLLDGIENLRLRYLSKSFDTLQDASWLNEWPLVDRITVDLPVAVEVTLSVTGFGEVKRIFELSPIGL